ncbi:formylglycine-generating enzyme family protein [Paeniglutamicibacter sp. NPDC091659]|uniref:formylglycine-generating enzyme family protein n=1 Tax=Paeniglutamicibacter sp. NPDC091659 TaxID=3364389 RepID=UPI003808C5A8
MQFASIPAGTMQLRDARSSSTRTVELIPFEIGTTPVKFGQWPNPGTTTNMQDSLPAHPVMWFAAIAWCNAESIAAGLKPAYVVNGREVHWNVDADGYRLPTEAEWEWACRAGTTEPTYGPLEDIAWTAADNVTGPQGVALKQPNDFGLFDMIGNVWEWCWDYADTARYGDYRSLRGGGWADKKWSCRAAVRRGSAPDAVLEDVGFRVARGPVGKHRDAAAQGWSAEADRLRAGIRGPLPVGWTPLRGLL